MRRSLTVTGLLNVDTGYVHDFATATIIPGAARSIRLCNQADFFVFVVTNQSGVARGYYEEADVVSFNNQLADHIRGEGARIDAFKYCPHHPEGKIEKYRIVCSCRKPAPGMILELLGEWGIDRQGSFLVGDKTSDLDAAKAAGITGYLYSNDQPLERLVEGILRQQTSSGESQ